MRRVRDLAIGAVAAVAVGMHAPAAHAGPPEVTAVVEGLDTSSGNGVLVVSGTKLTKFRTFNVRDAFSGDPVGAAGLLVKGRSQITLGLPPGLAAGTYTLSLEPRRGDPLEVTFSYRVDRNTFQGTTVHQSTAIFLESISVDDVALVGSSLGVGRFPARELDVSGSARVANANSRFETFGFPSGGGTVLAGTFASTEEGVGPQLRFADSTGFPFIDIGQDGAGDFVVEANDARTLSVRQDGSVATSGPLFVGEQFGGAELYVNGPVFGGGTVGITAKDAGSSILNLNREDGTSVLRVGAFGSADLEMLTGNAFKPGGGSWGVFSDARLKKDVVGLEGALDRLLDLRSVSFEYTDPQSIGERPGRKVGFLAQEVEKVFPDWVDERHDGIKTVSVKGFEALTVAALRELRAEKDAEIEAIRRRNAELESRLAAVEQMLARLAEGTPSEVAPAAPAPR